MARPKLRFRKRSSLEVIKLAYQEPEILMENIEEFQRELLQPGKDLALKKGIMGLNFPKIKNLVRGYQENPCIRLVDKEIIKKLQESLQDKLEKLEIPDSIDKNEFIKKYLKEIHLKLSSKAVSEELIKTRIDYILNDYNNSNSRGKYAYLTNLNSSKIPKAINHLKSFLEHWANCQDYKQNTYKESQVEASARILQYSSLIKDLLNKNPDLKAKIKNRPNRQPIDTQNDEWLEDLKKTQDGKNLLKYATNLRANSLLLQVSKSLKELIYEDHLTISEDVKKKIRKLSKRHAKLILKLSEIDKKSIKDFDIQEVIRSGTTPKTRSKYIRQDPNQQIYLSRNLPLDQIIVLLGYEVLKRRNQAWTVGDAINDNDYIKGMKRLIDLIPNNELAELTEEAIKIRFGLTN